jgi:quercetin dioxygenase-like cupin family protein
MTTLARPLAAHALRFDLDREAMELLEDLRNERAARTLVKDGSLRVTLVVLKPGGSIPKHSASGPVTIVPLVGAIRVSTPEECHHVEMPGLLSLAGGVQHEVWSETGGAFLLTIVDPGHPGTMREAAGLEDAAPDGVYLRA